MPSWIRGVLIQLTIGLALFLALDVLVSQFGLAGTNARARQDAINRSYRIRDDILHHTLAPNFSGFGQFGRLIYPVRTNSLGFVDGETRQVPKIAEKPRLVIMGDSFGEGIGLKWNDTFAGMLTKAKPDIDILNASVVSYSPIIYYRKLRWLLEQGYRFDHVLVLVDISDIPDSASYVLTDDKVTVWRPDGGPRGSLADEPNPWAPAPLTGREEMVERLRQRFQLTSLSIELARMTYHSIRPTRSISEYALSVCRGAWTYDGANPLLDARYAQNKAGHPIDLRPCPRSIPHQAAGAAPAPNLALSIARAQHWMVELHRVLEARGIKLSVAVYPWPAQLQYNDLDSMQVEIWKSFCANRCAQFVNIFPDFFDYRKSHPGSWYADLFIDGDVHFNARGNAILARRLQAVADSVKR